MMEVMKTMAIFSKRSCAYTGTLSAPEPEGDCHQPMPLSETPGYSQANLGQSLVGSLLLSPDVHRVLFVLSKSLFPQSDVSSLIKSQWPPKSNSLGVLNLFASSQGWKICCGS